VKRKTIYLKNNIYIFENKLYPFLISLVLGNYSSTAQTSKSSSISVSLFSSMIQPALVANADTFFSSFFTSVEAAAFDFFEVSFLPFLRVVTGRMDTGRAVRNREYQLDETRLDKEQIVNLSITYCKTIVD
jgi:hypothetical protein